MPSYSIQYEHMGRLYSTSFVALNLDDAVARLESIKATGEVDGEIIATQEASDDVVRFYEQDNDALHAQIKRVRRG